MIKKAKRISFPLHLKCLNFNANKGISETNNKLKIIEITHNRNGFNMN